MEPDSPSRPRIPVAACMLAAGALVAQQVAGKATRDALFLSTFDVTTLPAVMIAAAIVSGAAVLVLSSALSRRAPARVVPAMVAAATVLLLVEWGLSMAWPRLAAVAVYLHLAALGATVLSGYWSMVNEQFDPHSAREAMQRIALGASVGGVAGGLLAWSAAGVLSVPTMLAVMAALNVVALFAMRRLAAPAAATLRRAEDGAGTGPFAAVRVLREVPYLRDLGLVVALGAGTETLLDYLLSARAVAAFTDGGALMAFFAVFHTGLGLLALAVQVAASGPVLRTVGLAGAVALRPAAVAAGALLGLVDPRLWAAIVARGAHGVLHHSVFRASYEVLFTPVAERRKRPVKAIIDVGFDKLGAMAGAGLVLALAGLPGQGRALFAVAAAGGVAAVAVARRLQRGYVRALEDSLRSGIIRLEPADVLDSTTLLTLVRLGGAPEEAARDAFPAGDAVPDLVRDLRSGEAAVVRRALRHPQAGLPAMVGHVLPLLSRDDVLVDVLRTLRRGLPRATGQLVDALLDPALEGRLRRRLPRLLRAGVPGRAAEGLRQGLSDPGFAVRRQCALALRDLAAREPGLGPPPGDVFALARRELESGPPTWAEETDDVPGLEGSPGARPRTPAERGLAHVFTLLALALEPEPLRIAHWALLGDDALLRGTALEYLSHVLPDDVQRALWLHLGTAPAPRTGRSVQEATRELVRAGSAPRRGGGR